MSTEISNTTTAQMSNINEFFNNEFGTIRTMVINDEPWFVGKDVAGALGYTNSRDALATHVDDCDKMMGSQNATPSITAAWEELNVQHGLMNQDCTHLYLEVNLNQLEIQTLGNKRSIAYT